MRKRYLPVISVMIIIAACGGNVTTPKTPMEPHTIDVNVSGTSRANIFYGIGSDVSQVLDSTLPWTRRISTIMPLVRVAVTAQSKDTGQVHCKISIDGKVVNESPTTDQLTVATCTWSGQGS